MGVWHILEAEPFFLEQVPLQREITHPHKRLQHLAGRWLLKELYPEFPHGLIQIAATRKPFLANEAYHFSISHCGDYAAAIVSTENRVGVDIELVNNKVEKIRHKFMNLAEEKLMEVYQLEANGLNYHDLLTACWSVKETLYKWYGSGEVDFREHLHVESFHIQDNEGVAQCLFMKEALSVRMHVRFLFFNQNCLSWVITS